MAATLTGAARSRVIMKSRVLPTVDTEGINIWAINMNGIYNTLNFFSIFLGIIGNIITLIVLRNKKLRVNKTYNVLMAISFYNLVYLLSLIPNLLRWSDINENTRKWTCQLQTYLALLAVIIITYEIIQHAVGNLIINVYPQYSDDINILKHVYFTSVGLPIAGVITTIAISVLDIHMTNTCDKKSKHFYTPLFNSTNATSAVTMHLVAVVVLGMWTTIGKYWLKHKPAQVFERPRPTERPQYSSQECIDVWNTLETLANQERTHHDWSTYNEVDKIMCTVSKMFIVFTLPVCIASFFFEVHQSNAPGRWVALQRLLMMLFNTNFGINFFLYCLSGQNFRHEFIKCICCRRQADQRPRIARRNTPRIPRHHAVSNDSIVTYHRSSTEVQIPYEPDLVSTLPPPTTPRHEIMEWVELGVRHASSTPQTQSMVQIAKKLDTDTSCLDDSVVTYHRSSTEVQNYNVSSLQIPYERDLVSTLPPPTTPRHEIMEWVELGVRHASSIPQLLTGYEIQSVPNEDGSMLKKISKE